MSPGCCGGGGGESHGKQVMQGQMSEQQEEIAKWVRWNVKTKEAPVKGGDKRAYFMGQKAVDKIMESKFATQNAKDSDKPTIPDREHAVAMMNFFMRLGLFYRGEREYLVKKQKRIRRDSNGDTESETEEERRERKKKKFRLDLCENQTFVDEEDALFMWDFEPTHPYTWLGGTIVIIIGFLGVLYPLWPQQLRGGVYYLSWGGLGFVGFVIVLAILRTILYCLIWAATGGKHHLWIFPNLTEDCGPIESFFPIYSYKYTGPKDKKKKKKKKKAIEVEAAEAITEAAEEEADGGCCSGGGCSEPKTLEEKKDE